MKKQLFLFIMMLLPMMASAQTVSDVQNSGCTARTRGAEYEEPIPTIVLTKESGILSVEVQNIISNCATYDFEIKTSISDGIDGSPCSLSVNVNPVLPEELTNCVCPFNVSFTIRDLEPNSFYLDCWWYKGLVELTEGEPLVLEYNNPDTTEYFPEGTKWTEIRLDTLKYDSWYSKVGDEWVPNFETIEYYVQGNYPDEYWNYKKVYTNGPEWTDSLTLLIREGERDGHGSVMVSVPVHDYDGDSYVPLPGEAYQFDWNVGTGIYYEDIERSNCTCIYRFHFYYGVIDEIKEGYFGGVRPLKYVDLDGKVPDKTPDDDVSINIATNGGRMIQGIGITEWNSGECLFGPPNPYFALQMFDYTPGVYYPERNYRSMLVHFERNGEILYDVWPKKEADDYRPFIEEGKVWSVRVCPDGYGIVRNDTWTEHYYFDGDTIIGGQTCKRMFYITNANEENWVNGVFTPASHTQQYIGSWYEQDKKVYIAHSNRQQFELIYDFSLSTGDSIQDMAAEDRYWQVTKMSGVIPGFFKGTYYNLSLDGWTERWLEGVGNESKPYVYQPWDLCGPTARLLSCRVGSDVIYSNSEVEDPYVMGARKGRFDFTHTIKTQPKAPTRGVERQAGDEEASLMESLYGEYSDLQLGIHLDPLDDDYQVSITDESGNVVYGKAVNAGTIMGLSIDISAYAKGRYTVTIENSRESFIGQFENETTGISDATRLNDKGKKINDKPIYNLQGQRISSLQKGLNIVDGRKVHVR